MHGSDLILQYLQRGLPQAWGELHPLGLNAGGRPRVLPTSPPSSPRRQPPPPTPGTPRRVVQRAVGSVRADGDKYIIPFFPLPKRRAV